MPINLVELIKLYDDDVNAHWYIVTVNPRAVSERYNKLR